MPEVYYYASSDKVSDIIDCGLKLSASYDKEVLIDGNVQQCFVGLINPRDDINSYNSQSLTCIKINVRSDKCYVADSFVYDTIKDKPENLELYNKSVIPLEKYIFGTYRKPECLITSTILAGEASRLDRCMDLPVIYENSEALYINNILNNFKEQYNNFDDHLLYSLFSRLAEMGKVDTIKSSDGGKAIFISSSGELYCIRKPELIKIFQTEVPCEK
ncbi:hypothetical protein [Ruminiclostridium cellulolyticum]|uniref:Uncharacterized protein n=1 Tax=Ruminiclostridium cellulolyticum (strain ATCC 35319 / DSM 5812 / JCM 6584 / H10) TaxID=394503 RepID=B8I4G7_RUMCH|nr:hypothetical protein [Ruminiclostridium cellulolyticum]ACL74521.1 conserved hypothetical protein [Ruminiclostridium cellulolyticum H10]